MRRHHYTLLILILIFIIAIGVGGSYWHHRNQINQQNKMTQSSRPINRNYKSSNKTANNTSSEPKINSNNQSTKAIKKPKKVNRPVNRPGYTLSVLPNNLYGTWYSYDEGKLDTLTITSNKTIFNGNTQNIHACKKGSDPDKLPKHSNWSQASMASKAIRGLHFLVIYAWNQSAGNGMYYALINNNKMPVLDYSTETNFSTDANFFRSKSQAKQNKKKTFNGEKTNW